MSTTSSEQLPKVVSEISARNTEDGWKLSHLAELTPRQLQPFLDFLAIFGHGEFIDKRNNEPLGEHIGALNVHAFGKSQCYPDGFFEWSVPIVVISPKDVATHLLRKDKIVIQRDDGNTRIQLDTQEVDTEAVGVSICLDTVGNIKQVIERFTAGPYVLRSRYYDPLQNGNVLLQGVTQKRVPTACLVFIECELSLLQSSVGAINIHMPEG